MMGMGVTALFLTPLCPLHAHIPHTPTPFYLALHNASTQVQCPFPHLGLWPNGPFPPTARFSFVKVLPEISRALRSEQCLGAGLPNDYIFFSFWGWAMSRVTVQGCSSYNILVIANLGWEFLLEHLPTNWSLGNCAQDIAGLKSQLVILICAFNTLNCPLTPLSTGPTYSPPKKPKLFSCWLEFSLSYMVQLQQVA